MLIFGAASLTAQLKTPAPSPSAKFTQDVGLTTITVEYSRPSMKGRAIFGGLLSMGDMWRTGANKNTTVQFSTDVTVGGKELKAGTYALYTKPMADEWEIYFYTDTENWGVPQNWEDSKVAAKFTAKSQKMPISMESLLLSVGNIDNNSADFQIFWENTFVKFEIGVPTNTLVSENIKKVMAGPSNRDYYDAASYYLAEKTNLDTALEYINKSISMDYEKFWSVRKKAQILAELGQYKEAIKAAERSMELAKEAGNNDYVKNNEASIAEWKKMK